MKSPLPISTERLVLRDFRPEDVAAVHAYGSDPEVVRYMPFGPNTEAESQAFLARKLQDQLANPRTGFGLAITLAASGELIGSCALRVTAPERQEAEIGYVLRRDVWGQGYATEAARALVALGFAHLGMHRIQAYCRVENAASARVLEKAGMRREGLLREHVMMHGRWDDSYLYAVVEGDWRSLAEA